MIAKIAGREVKVGDQLYNSALQMWGRVTGVDFSGTVQIEFVGAGKGNIKNVTMTDGGYVNGRRVMYWHKPIDLDLPQSDVSAYQQIVDTLVLNKKEFSK